MIKYRILERIYNDCSKEYIVQVNPLFGFPLLWFTASYYFLDPPHPDLGIPAVCEVNCVFNNILDAQKCLYGFTHKDYKKVVKEKSL